MGASKNMTRGFIFTALYVVITIVVPLLSLTLISELGSIAGTNVGLDFSERIVQIRFWVLTFGFLISGVAFFAFSSPSQSIRRGIFALIQIALNCLYLWSYKFSGALELIVPLVDASSGATLGIVGIDITTMIMLYLGIYFLTIVLKTFDLVDFIVNRKKIKYLRVRGKLKEREKIEKKLKKERVKEA